MTLCGKAQLCAGKQAIDMSLCCLGRLQGIQRSHIDQCLHLPILYSFPQKEGADFVYKIMDKKEYNDSVVFQPICLAFTIHGPILRKLGKTQAQDP